MDNDRFNALARVLGEMSSRRTTTHLLVALGLGGALASPAIAGAAGNRRRKKKRCQPCRRKRNRRCKRKKPDGLQCGSISVCKDGSCRLVATDACSPSNDFCQAGEWEHCLEEVCGCFMTVENDPICGNILDFGGCPATTECNTSADCGSETSFCVALPCCPEGKAACRPLCVT